MYCRLLISCHDICDAHRSVLDVTVYQHLAASQGQRHLWLQTRLTSSAVSHRVKAIFRTYKANLVLAGQAVEQVDRYKYLGLVMHQNGTFTCAVESLKSAAQRALFALQARCAELGIVDTQLRCKLYDAVVKPVLSYGCEVWVPLVSDTSLEELERVHLSFLRRILDVPRATAAKHLCAETGRLPHKTFGGSKASNICTT